MPNKKKSPPAPQGSAKTIGVQLATIKYGCGCVSEMDKMVYCPLHASAPALLAALVEAPDLPDDIDTSDGMEALVDTYKQWLSTRKAAIRAAEGARP